MPEKIAVGEIGLLSKEEFVARFCSVYEHSPWVAEEAWNARPFGSVDDLHEAMAGVVDGAPEGRKMALIRAHPDLAGKAAMAGELTPESRREQASAVLDKLSPEEYEAFHRLNGAYREKFGFPIIFAVREHTMESILKGAEERLGNPEDKEAEVALAEIHRIARLRLDELVRDER